LSCFAERSIANKAERSNDFFTALQQAKHTERVEQSHNEHDRDGEPISATLKGRWKEQNAAADECLGYRPDRLECLVRRRLFRAAKLTFKLRINVSFRRGGTLPRYL